MQAKVTDELSKGFIEVAPLDSAGNPGKQRFIAEDPGRKKARARRGDIVEISPIESSDGGSKRVYFYIIPVVLFVVGFVMTSTGMQERILSGVLLGFMGFVVAWILNRRARLAQRQVYHVLRIVQKAKDVMR